MKIKRYKDEKIKWHEDSSAQSAIRNMHYIALQCNPYFQMTLVEEYKKIQRWENKMMQRWVQNNKKGE